MCFDQTYMVYRTFAEFLESKKIFEKSSHGPELSEKSNEKVNTLKAKEVLNSKNSINRPIR